MPLKVGDRFSSYKDVKDAMHKYEEEMFTKYPKRDSRTIAAARLRIMKRHVNEKLIYYEIKFACVFGGKQFKTHSTGKRRSRTCKKDCPAFVRFKISEDGESLQLMAMNEQHLHHDQDENNSPDIFLSNETEEVNTSKKTKKRLKRRSVTMEEKMFAIQKLEEGVSYKIVAKEYGVDESTVKDWKKVQAAIEDNCCKCMESGEIMLRKKRKFDHNEVLGDFIYHWYMHQLDKNISVSESQIQEKARAVNTATGGKSSFIANQGWLYKWKTRYGIHLNKSERESRESTRHIETIFSGIDFNESEIRRFFRNESLSENGTGSEGIAGDDEEEEEKIVQCKIEDRGASDKENESEKSETSEKIEERKTTDRSREEIDFNTLIPEIKLEVEVSSTPVTENLISINDTDNLESSVVDSKSNLISRSFQDAENCSNCLAVQREKIKTATNLLLKLRAEIDKILENLEKDSYCGIHKK